MTETELCKVKRANVALDRPDRIVRFHIVLNPRRKEARQLSALAGLECPIHHETNPTSFSGNVSPFLPSLTGRSPTALLICPSGRLPVFRLRSPSYGERSRSSSYAGRGAPLRTLGLTDHIVIARSGLSAVAQRAKAESDQAIHFPSFRDGPKDQTQMCNCTSGNPRIPGSMRSLSSGRASRGPVGIAPE